MNPNDYNLLALDMDGTILNSAHQLTAPVRLALAQVADRGVRVVLTSARSPSSMRPYLEQIGLRELFVALNGALVVDSTHTLLHRRPMGAAEVETVLTLCTRYGLTPNLYTGFSWYVAQVNAMIERQIDIVKFRPQVGPFPDTILTTIEKILVMGEESAQRAFYADLCARQLQLLAAFSKPTYCEITAADVSKAAGLRYVCARLEIPAEAVVAVGDNFNDAEMLAFAGYGVAMGNAPAEVKRLARQVIGGNDADGVAHFLRETFLADL